MRACKYNYTSTLYNKMYIISTIISKTLVKSRAFGATVVTHLTRAYKKQ